MGKFIVSCTVDIDVVVDDSNVTCDEHAKESAAAAIEDLIVNHSGFSIDHISTDDAVEVSSGGVCPTSILENMQSEDRFTKYEK